MSQPRQSSVEQVAYFRGVADALDAIREYEFPHTDCVDWVADKLAPSRSGPMPELPHEARMKVMREVAEWLRGAPRTLYMAHSTRGVGLTRSEREMTTREAADELERQIAAGIV